MMEPLHSTMTFLRCCQPFSARNIDLIIRCLLPCLNLGYAGWSVFLLVTTLQFPNLKLRLSRMSLTPGLGSLLI